MNETALRMDIANLEKGKTMIEDVFDADDLRYYVQQLLDQEEETDEFYFTLRERRTFQYIVQEALEDWIQKQEGENETGR